MSSGLMNSGLLRISVIIIAKDVVIRLQSKIFDFEKEYTVFDDHKIISQKKGRC